MTQSSNDGQIIDSLQVLVIAEQVIADRIRLYFSGKGMNIEVKSPPQQERELKWLIDLLFSDAPVDDSERLGKECSLFAWNRFDIVILSDIWWAEAADLRMRYAAGRVFALWDNNRGNFATRKIVLVSDADDFEGMAKGAFTASGLLPANSKGLPVSYSEHLGRTLDPKRSIALVDASRSDFLAQLEFCIYSRTKAPRSDEMEETSPQDRERLSDAADNLTRPVIRMASISLRKMFQSTQIFSIDDEQSALRSIYEALTGEDASGVPWETLPGRTVQLLNINNPGTVSDGLFDVFDELKAASLCEVKAALNVVNADGNSGVRDVVIVTDILFELGDSTRTGIDIIGILRKAFKARVGIIAFTSFTTPFIAMAAYRQGADYVIPKEGVGGRHDSLRLNGFDRLVEALAILSFQRDYLRRVRQYCLDRVENLGGDDELPEEILRVIRLFERTMPQRTVSLHMQREWEDTYWLLKTVQTENGIKLERFKLMLNEFRRRY